MAKELEGNETCVGAKCGVDLGYPKSALVDDPRRLGQYVEGAGQLCPKCWNEIYNRPKTDSKADIDEFLGNS